MTKLTELEQAFESLHAYNQVPRGFTEGIFIGYFTKLLGLHLISDENAENLITASCNMYFSGTQPLWDAINALEDNYEKNYDRSVVDKVINHYFSASYDKDATNFNELDNFGQIMSKYVDEVYTSHNSQSVRYLTILSALLYIESQHSFMYDWLQYRDARCESYDNYAG